MFWAFGSGVQAVTPVMEREGRWVEHRLSWYAKGDRLSLTPGHAPEAPFDLGDALGLVQSERNASRCFGCHRPNEEPGVHCQACHGDGDVHRKAPAKGNIRRDRSVALCAQCHRSPDGVFASEMPELDDPLSVRFAPVGLQASLCFKKGKGLTCVSCHDPHGEARAKTVGQVCSGCHGKAVKRGCPREPDCAGCHMKPTSPVPNLTFTDHRIRVYP